MSRHEQNLVHSQLINCANQILTFCKFLELHKKHVRPLTLLPSSKMFFDFPFNPRKQKRNSNVRLVILINFTIAIIDRDANDLKREKCVRIVVRSKKFFDRDS